MLPFDLLETAKEVGIPFAILLYFIFRDYQRDKRNDEREVKLENKLSAIEEYQKNQLQQLVLATNTKIGISTSLERDLLQALRTRKCLIEDVDRMINNEKHT